MRSQITIATSAIVMLFTGCRFGEVKQRQVVLEQMCATNAPYSTVTNAIGRIPVYKRGSRDWNTVMNTHMRSRDSRNQRIVDKMNRAEAVGVTSTMSTLTYIFLDDQERLVDFQVDSQ